MTRDEYIQDYDDRHRDQGREGSGTGEWERKWQLWQDAGFIEGMSILDYGCGFGAMVTPLKDRSKYLGVDISKHAVELAQSLFPDTRFEVFEIGKLKCAKKDWVVAHSVLTHTLFQDVPDSLSDIKRALKGIALIDILDGEKREDGHVVYWPLPEFLEELQRAGLRGEEIARIAWSNGFTHTYVKVQHL